MKIANILVIFREYWENIWEKVENIRGTIGNI